MKGHLFVYPSSEDSRPIALTNRPGMTITQLENEPGLAARQIEEALNQQPEPDVLAFWDVSLGAFPWKALERFSDSLDDVWHPGPGLTGTAEPDLMRYVQPLGIYRRDPREDLAGAVNWKLD